MKGDSTTKSTPGQMMNRWQHISNLSAGIWYEFRVVAKSGEYQAASSWKKITLPKPGD